MKNCQNEDQCETPMWCRGKDKCQKQAESVKATGPLDAAAGSLPDVVAEWEREVAKKWREIRDSKGHWIAIYSPQWGHAEDLRRRRETSMEVMKWTVQWFNDRGHEIECVIMADGESLAIREANETAHLTAEKGTENE